MRFLKTSSRLSRSACAVALVCTTLSRICLADVFGTGDNRFTIDFLPVAADTNPASGHGIVKYNYRMGIYQVTNDQWDNFEVESGLQFTESVWQGADLPVNNKSWLEAAQFVNWLNTSTGHQPAYNFDEQGVFQLWSVEEAWRGTNLYRHKDAFYFLPSGDEWDKAGYWNGTTLQTYATPDGELPIAGADSNYSQSTPYTGPWAVGSGSEELNGTYNMMGNVWELLESPKLSDGYTVNAYRYRRGGSYTNGSGHLVVSYTGAQEPPTFRDSRLGFRVASVPEPASIVMLLAGVVGLLLWRRPSVL